MAIDIPILTNYDRYVGGTAGEAEADNVPADATCHAFAVGYLQWPTPPIIEVGATVGPGPVGIVLDLHAFVLNFFGIHIPMPISLFVMNEIGGNFSAPSVIALPVLWDQSYSVSIGDIRRKDDGTTVTVEIFGMEDGASLIMFWTNYDGSLGQASLSNGHNEIGGFAWNRPYSFVFINFNHLVQIGKVQTAQDVDYRICRMATV